jgi:hypothetical protein
MPEGPAGAIAAAILVVVAAIVAMLGAVRFGLSVLAPRIGRAIDRVESDDEEPSDRPD